MKFSGNLDAEAAGHVTEALIYDSQGRAYSLNLTFTKTADNEWNLSGAELRSAAGDLVPGITLTGLGAELRFTANGSFVPAAASQISITGLLGGAEDLQISLDFSSLSQKVGKSNARMDTQDGFPVGVLESYMVGNRYHQRHLYQWDGELGQIARQLANRRFNEGVRNLYALANSESQTLAAGKTAAVPLKHLRWKCPMLTCL